MGKQKTTDDEILKVLHTLSNITGQSTTYGALLGFLNHLTKHAKFHADALRPQSLVWDDCAIITLDAKKPIIGLTMQDDVTVKDVIMLRDTSLPAHSNAPQPKLLDGANAEPIILQPGSVIARVIANHTKAMKYINAAINRDHAAYEQELKTAWKDKYIACMDSRTMLNAVKAVAVLKQLDDDTFTGKLKEWFPLHAKEAKKHADDIEQYMKNVHIKTEEEGRLAFMLWGAFQDSEYINIADCDDALQTTFTATKEAIERPCERIGLPIKKPSTAQRKLRDLMRNTSLFAMGNETAEGLYEAIHDLFASEGLSIDILEHVNLNNDDCLDILSATQCAVMLSDSEDCKNAEYTARCAYALMAMKAATKQLRAERDAVIAAHQTIEKLQASLTEEKVKAKQEAPKINESELTKLKDATAAAEQIAGDKQAKLNEAQITIDKLTVANDQLTKENEELREFMNALQQADESEQEQAQLTAQNMPTSRRAIPDGTVLVGGHPRWQKMFKAAYPQVRVIDGVTPTFSTDLFNAKTPLVLINPLHMKHSVWQRLMPYVRRYKIRYEYCTRINNELVQN